MLLGEERIEFERGLPRTAPGDRGLALIVVGLRGDLIWLGDMEGERVVDLQREGEFWFPPGDIGLLDTS